MDALGIFPNDGYGYGYSYGNGYGNGTGYGYGNSYGNGTGNGYGNGNGTGTGYGNGNGTGTGYGNGTGTGTGYGCGFVLSVSGQSDYEVTNETLENAGACSEGIEDFIDAFPDGTTFPGDLAEAEDAGLEVSWAIHLGLFMVK